MCSVLLIFSTYLLTAYLGAAHLLQNPDTITEAGSILTTEARQASWVNSAVLKGTPWSGSFDVPLTAQQVCTISFPSSFGYEYSLLRMDSLAIDHLYC